MPSTLTFGRASALLLFPLPLTETVSARATPGARLSVAKQAAAARDARVVGRIGGSERSSGAIAGSRGARCRRGESNPYAFRHGNLNPARLPIPPLLRNGPDYTILPRPCQR